MPEQENKPPPDPAEIVEAQSFTAWLSPALMEKLNRMAIKRSTAKRLMNRADVVRELIERARE